MIEFLATPQMSAGDLERFDAKYVPVPYCGCWLWDGPVANGYGRLGIGGRKGRCHYAHRLSYRHHKGPVPAGLLVLHTCDVPACVNPDHLYAGTRTDNLLDAVRRGRHARTGGKGSANPASRWTEADVLAMRRLFASGISAKAVAERFGCPYGSAWQIVTGRSWKHVGTS